MDMYLTYMHSIIDFVNESWLAKKNDSTLKDRGAIRGCSDKEIKRVEQKIGKTIPDSLRAWYLVAGEVPPYLYDYDADFSIRDFSRAQQTAKEMAQWNDSRFEFTKEILPFSQRIGESLLFLKLQTGLPQDPEVFSHWDYIDDEDMSKKTPLPFSVFIREVWIGWMEFSLQTDARINWIKEWRESGGTMEDWRTEQTTIAQLRDDTDSFRTQLLLEVYQQDLSTNSFTNPQGFQEIWIDSFSKTETWKEYESLGKRVPFSWINPPKEKSIHLTN